jgi:adenylyl cyclase-associated protein
LLGRLEAATSRLEDIASSTELPKDVPGLAQPATPQSETAATPLPPAPKEPQEPQEALPESIEDFDVFLNTSLDKYIKLSSQLGGVSKSVPTFSIVFCSTDQES